MNFNEKGRKTEISKEEYEMSHKLLIEKVKQVMCDKIEKLGYEELIKLKDIEEGDLRGIANVFRRQFLKSSITNLPHWHISDIDVLAD